MPDRDDVLSRFAENGLDSARLPVGDGSDIILAAKGGHVLGPFDRNGRSVLWLNPAFGDVSGFVELSAKGDWNIGGLRLWIAPEINYGVRDRRRYWETLTVQEGMEPAAAAITTGVRGELLTEYENYYEPLEASHLRVSDRHAELRLDGLKRFKIGVRSRCHFGRVGHVRRPDAGAGETELIVCSWYNDPGAWYAEQPADNPGCRGLSMHLYNDGGMFGGFGELEANGRTLGYGGYPDSLEDSFSLWFYRGSAKAINRVGQILLGIKDIL